MNHNPLSWALDIADEITFRNGGAKLFFWTFILQNFRLNVESKPIFHSSNWHVSQPSSGKEKKWCFKCIPASNWHYMSQKSEASKARDAVCTNIILVDPTFSNFALTSPCLFCLACLTDSVILLHSMC